jgi:hypothetical protein
MVMSPTFEANYDNETYARLARMFLNGVSTEEMGAYQRQRYEHKLMLLGLIEDAEDNG